MFPVTDDVRQWIPLNICHVWKESLPAVEALHRWPNTRKIASSMDKDQIIVINLSGRGEKDVAAIARYKGVELYE